MSSNIDLESVIEDSVSDSLLPPDTDESVESEVPEPAAADPTPDPEPTESDAQVAAPVSPETPDPTQPEQDEFEKQFGIPAQSAPGRENRIPYSRVKKIVQKAIAEKTKELEGGFTPKLQDYETKVKSYEERLGKVAKFEEVMLNDPETFLQRLSAIPTYQPFFQAVESLISAHGAAATPAEPAQVSDDMPAPNRTLPDGSMVYDMDGLKDLLAWQAQQVEGRLLKQVEDHYGPIRQEWQTEQQVRSALPQIRAQLAEARTWPMFTDNEEEITKVLQANPQASLEGAYRQVVYPKLVANRDTMRQDLLKEIKTAPKSTAAPSTSVKTAASKPAGNRSLEDVINEAIGTIK